MLSVDEALARTAALPVPRRVRWRGLGAALGAVLAEEVRADLPLPPFDNSAMDGYAVPDGLSAGGALPVSGRRAAGDAPGDALAPGTAIRIFTGAAVPPGATAVIAQEDATPADGGTVRFGVTPQAGQHIRRAGSDLAAGATALAAGTILHPGAIALAAACGRSRLRVADPPRIAILGTGDELVPPGRRPPPGSIRATNNPMLAAWVAASGGVPLDLGVAGDRRAALESAFARALDQRPDLILSTGGVSVGELDLVRAVLGGDALDFWKVRMKPGKPLAVGRVGGVPVFALPGNPASAAVSFTRFVRPWIRRALGDPSPHSPVIDVRLRSPVLRSPGRPELWRASVRLAADGVWHADPAASASSGSLVGLSQANALLLFGEGRGGAEAGDSVPALLLHAAPHGSTVPALRWGGRPSAGTSG